MIPEEPSMSEKLNDTDEDAATFNKGLDEVQEVDEEISDDIVASPKPEIDMITKQLQNE